MVTLSVVRRSRTKGGLVTFGTIAGLVIAMGVTLFGTGAANHAVASFDASSWLWSKGKGELARVNGVTGRVDTRTKITDAQGHTMQVTQSDRYVILRDLTTGKISVLDLSSLTLGTTTQTTPGLGVTVALHDNTAFIIDAVQGLVRQLDPATLAPIGQPLSFPAGITGGTFDDSGTLWLLVPSEGTVVAIKPAPVASPKAGRPSAGSGGSAAGGRGGGTTTDPVVAHSAVVADPSHELTLSILDTGVAVLDKTADVMTTVRGNKTHKVDLKLSGPGAMPSRTVGPDVPVTVVDDSHVYVVDGDTVHDFTAPGTSPRIQPCTAWSARLYCPDDATGHVYVLDTHGHLTKTIAVPDAGRGLDLEVREGHLFINSPDTSNAVVVDDHHNATTVNKYTNNVLGGDLPPAPPPPPVTKPVVGPPSAPAKVNATAGNTTAHITWQAALPNGAAITKYVVEGDGQSHVVGANQRALDVTGLTNGQTYKFTVYAANAKGNGPKRAANPVIPTSEVPDPPVSVAAVANPNGTVTITWPAANGQGHKIPHYTVTAVSTGEPKTFDATAATFTTKPGDLAYGTQYAFKVASVNDIGASSAQSPLSPTVVPFAAPAAPGALQVRAVTTKRGTISAAWQMPEANGAAITGYQVTVNGAQKQTVTGTSVEIPGFADNTKVSVSVSAVNKAGAGPAATGAGTTLAMPTLTLQPSTGNQLNAITVNFTATDGGGTPPTCTLQVSGAGNASNHCAGALTVTGLWPGNTYSYTLTVSNAAGMAVSATGSLGTPAYHGTVICSVNSYCGHGASNGGIWIYRVPDQTPNQSVGDVFHPDSYQAICHVNGSHVDATPWGGKSSNVWIRIVFPGTQQNYIPYAWFTLDSGDSYNVIPSC